MKQEIGPGIIAVVVIIAVVLVGFAGFRYLGIGDSAKKATYKPGQMSAGMIGNPPPNSGGGYRMSGGMSGGAYGGR